MKRKNIVYPTGHPFIPYINSTGGGSGVDDVLEFANLAAFPATGITGAIYVANDTGKAYRWNGTTYVQLVVTKSDIGLGNVDNTSDADKPVSTAQANAIALKQTKAIQVTAVSVSTASWTLVSGFYEKSISDSNITAGSIVDVIPDNSSVSIVQAAEFTSLTTSAAGSVKVYAKNIPSAAITVTLNIWL